MGPDDPVKVGDWLRGPTVQFRVEFRGGSHRAERFLSFRFKVGIEIVPNMPNTRLLK